MSKKKNNRFYLIFTPEVFPIIISILAVGFLLVNRLVIHEAGLGFLGYRDDDSIATGILFNPTDNFFYLSFPQQVSQENIFSFLNPHTFDEQTRIYFNPLFLIIGFLSKSLHIYPFGVLVILGIISMVFVITSIYKISRLVGYSHLAASLSCVIIAFASGFSGLIQIFDNSSEIPYKGADFIFQDAITFSAFYAYPYHSIAYALLSLIILLILRIEEIHRREMRNRIIHFVILSVLMSIAASTHPYEVLMIGLSYGIFALIAARKPNQKFRIHLYTLIAMALGTIPISIYNFWVSTQPVWSQFSSLASLGLGQSRLFWVIGYGFTLILAMYGSYHTFDRKYYSSGNWFAIWTLLLFYLLIVLNVPFSKIISGAFLSIGIMAGFAIDLIIQKINKFISPKKEISLFLFGLLASFLLFTSTVYLYFQEYRGVRINLGLVELTNQIEYSKLGETKVLSDPQTSLELTALAPVQVYSSHWALTPNYDEKIIELRDAGILIESRYGDKKHLRELLERIDTDFIILHNTSSALAFIKEISEIKDLGCNEIYCLFSYQKD